MPGFESGEPVGTPVLRIEVAGEETVLTWKDVSAFPKAGTSVFPAYRVERSLDLQTWTPPGDGTSQQIGGQPRMHTISFPGGEIASEAPGGRSAPARWA